MMYSPTWSLVKAIEYFEDGITVKCIEFNGIWGYKPDGSAQSFFLKEGEKLPDGWSNQPGDAAVTKAPPHKSCT